MCNNKAASKENEEYEYSNPHSNKKKGRNRMSKQLEYYLQGAKKIHLFKSGKFVMVEQIAV